MILCALTDAHQAPARRLAEEYLSDAATLAELLQERWQELWGD
ncbi:MULTISPECIES: hypothetical protein [unclassified Kribbella]